MAVIAVFYALSKKGAIEAQIVEKAIRDLNVNSKKLPIRSYVEGFRGARLDGFETVACAFAARSVVRLAPLR